MRPVSGESGAEQQHRRRTGPGTRRGRKWIEREPGRHHDEADTTLDAAPTSSPAAGRGTRAPRRAARRCTTTITSSTIVHPLALSASSRACLLELGSENVSGQIAAQRPVHERHEHELAEHADRDADDVDRAEPQAVVARRSRGPDARFRSDRCVKASTRRPSPAMPRRSTAAELGDGVVVDRRRRRRRGCRAR